MSPEERSKIETLILESPWKNAYWFARMLIASDKYGAVGKKSELLAQITAQLHMILGTRDHSDETKLKLCKNVITSLVEASFQNAKSVIDRVKLFNQDLSDKIQTLDDIRVFILTAEAIMIPINNAMTGIPSNDREYTEATAKAYLDSLGTQGLATVINVWDDLGANSSIKIDV